MPTPLNDSVWDFPTPSQMPKDDLVILGADLQPETILDSYKNGIFPMHIEIENKIELGWWSPQFRGVMPLNKINVSKYFNIEKDFLKTFNQFFFRFSFFVFVWERFVSSKQNLPNTMNLI